jgi:deoxyribose-phosphate aldolase
MEKPSVPTDLDRRVSRVLDRALLGEPPCSCHGVPRGCCPGPTSPPTSLASFIDHTLLAADATPERVRALCREGQEHGFRTVCVNPVFVELAASLLRGSTTTVCTVVGFPLGASGHAKALEARQAISAGASEIDMVIWIGGLRAGELEAVFREIDAVVTVCHKAGAKTKVILETAALSREETVRGALLCAAAGADFVKTSTGFGPGGASPEAVALLHLAVGAGLGVKASGGIQDLKTAQLMLSLGATRLGTSSGVRILEDREASSGGPR